MIKQRSFTSFLLLTIITCGIYAIFFYYQLGEDMNQVCAGDGEETPSYLVAFLLGLITLGIYPIFWYYKVADRQQRNAPRYGFAISEGGSTYLLWLIVGYLACYIGSFYAQYILIKNMNTLAAAYNNHISGGPPPGGGYAPQGGYTQPQSPYGNPGPYSQ